MDEIQLILNRISNLEIVLENFYKEMTERIAAIKKAVHETKENA
jgi:hypothetical protein